MAPEAHISELVREIVLAVLSSLVRAESHKINVRSRPGEDGHGARFGQRKPWNLLRPWSRARGNAASQLTGWPMIAAVFRWAFPWTCRFVTTRCRLDSLAYALCLIRVTIPSKMLIVIIFAAMHLIPAHKFHVRFV
jgi:hypothetical protein